MINKDEFNNACDNGSDHEMAVNSILRGGTLFDGKFYYMKGMTRAVEVLPSLDLSSLDFDGVGTADYPDFSDAYVTYGQFDDGRELTDDELDLLNDSSDLWYDELLSRLF